jgi:DNA-binding NarL/FixJ family response regulator/GAF domain-containing protein
LTRNRQARQQGMVAELGDRRARIHDAIALMDEAVAMVSRTLDVELVAVAERMAVGDRLLLRSGAGWKPGRVGRVQSAGGTASLDGYVLETGEPLVCEDVARETRCRPSPVVVDHEVVSAAVVPISGHRAPFGALGVFSRRPRQFGEGEVNFLRAIANVLSSAFERAQMEQQIRDVRGTERRRSARAPRRDASGAGRRARGTSAGAGDDDLVAALKRIRQQIRGFRLGVARDQPLAPRLEELMVVQRAAAPDVEFELTVRDVSPRLPDEMSTHLLRIAGEALTNARRHASVRRIEVRVSVDDDLLVASIADDGRDVAPGRSVPAGCGHGLVGMRTRAELLGGELRLLRTAGGGTTVELRAPLRARPAPGECLRVLLVDDHAAIREVRALAFTEDGGFVVVGQAGALAEARTMLEDVDVAIIDLTLPDGHGADLIPALRASSPDAQAVVLSAHADRAATANAVEKGATAVLTNPTDPHDLIAAVSRLDAGDTLIPRGEMVAPPRFTERQRDLALHERRLAEALTPRERQVLQLLADGLDAKHVAARLHITHRTQRNHVTNILAKLGVHSQLQALVVALRNGIVELPRATALPD